MPTESCGDDVYIFERDLSRHRISRSRSRNRVVCLITYFISAKREGCGFHDFVVQKVGYGACQGYGVFYVYFLI
jgi:hypothetical protein